MRRDLKAIIWLLSLFLFTSFSVFGQGSFGALRGTVTDSAGAVISGATVEIKNQDTNETRTVTTNESGEFIVNNLNVGSYTITANSSGFATSTIKDVRVSVAFTTEQTVALGAAGAEAVVNITGSDAATQINTNDQQLSTIITNQKIQDLPLLSRDPSSLVLLAPGTVQTDSGLGGFSINGSRERNNNFMVDGVDNNDTDVPGIPGGIATPNIDATEEFRVITGNFNAEYGRNTGGVITIATKRGTNDFHGNAYLYYRSDKYAARNFFSEEVDPLDRKQYGGSLGGPIWKDKAFFFFNYEGNRSKAGGEQFRAVPTAAARTGVFTTSEFGTLDLRPGSPNNQLGEVLGIPDPVFSPISLAMLNRIFPLPNYPANGAVPAPLPGLFELYNFNYVARDQIDSIAARVDFRIKEKHTLTFSANYGKGDFSLFAPTFDTFNDEARTPQVGGVYALNLLSTFSSNMVNELRIGTNRADVQFNGAGDGESSNALNDEVNSIFSANGASLPNFGPVNARALNIFTPFTSIGNFDTQGRITGTTTIGDSFTWVKGNHTMKFGGEARLVYSDGQSNFGRQESIDTRLSGNFGIPVVADNMGGPLDPFGTGGLVNDYLNFISGIVAIQTQTQFFGKDGQRDENDLRRYRTNEYSLFFQDSWRVRSDLTLNLGVRWDYNTTPFEKDGLLSNLVDQDPSGVAPAGGFRFITVGKNSDNPEIPLYASDKNNFAPRVGFAYSPSFDSGILGKIFGGPGKSSFRGGAGIFYDRVFTNLFGNTSANLPFSQSQQIIPLNGAGGFTLSTTPRVPTGTSTSVAMQGDEAAAVIFPTERNNILQHKFQMPESYSWNFGFQRDLGGNFLIEADYVGTKGVRLLRSADALLTSVRRVNAINGTNTPISSNLRTNYLNGTLNQAFGHQGAFLIVSNGNSSYNAMQLRATKTIDSKRFGSGQFQAFYTWGHSIDDAPDALVTGAGDRSLPRDSSGFSGGFEAERGDSSFDVRHRFVTNFIYEIPFLRGNDTWLKKIAGNWVISGIYQVQSGFPISIFMNGIDRQGTGLSARASFATPGNAFTSTQTPDNIRNYTGPSRTLFAEDVPLDGNQGNVGRSTFRGPKFSKMDLSLIKRFPINETMRFSIRADFFNLFNTVNFAVPITDVLNPNFGVSTGAFPARIIQFAGRFDF